MFLILTVQSTNKPFVFDVDQITELVIGRLDPSSGISPDVDLHEHNALELGVSRRHAAIGWRDGTLHLIDLNSPNGTYLNGQRLLPGQSLALGDGDTLQVGRLTLKVNLQSVPPTDHQSES